MGCSGPPGKPRGSESACRRSRRGSEPRVQGAPPGRPRRVTQQKIDMAVNLKSSGLSWAIAAMLIGIPAETLRKYARTHRKADRASRPCPKLPSKFH
jgi:hypothetical protein